MRPIEALLALANLLAFVALIFSRRRAARWMHYAPPIALLIAVAQILVEGARWQMIPAYGLASLFFLAVLTRRVAFGWFVSLGVVGLAVFIALPIVLPVFRLPHPSGPYEIGSLTYHWVDATRLEIFSVDANARRELMVQIWYPAKAASSSSRARYIQDADAVALALARLRGWPGFSFAHLKYVTSHAITSAAVSDDPADYPVLIFMEGPTGFRQMNTFQVEELVSHGYVIAALDQPYAAATVVFPDGRQVAGLAKDKMNALIQQSVEPVQAAPTLNRQTFANGIVPYLAQDATFTLDQLSALN